MPVAEGKQKTQLVQAARDLYTTNRIVKFCTNGTVVLGFLGVLWQGGAYATNQVDEYFAKAADVRTLQKGQNEARQEQKDQRQLMERQGRQLDFIYYDSMKREKTNLQSEIFKLRSGPVSAAIRGRIDQLVDDLRDLKDRIRRQEAKIRGQR